MSILKIIAGGQTGVDRAALDAAIECKIPHGGWCPKNRIAENGRIDSKYQLMETTCEDYEIRTKKNVEDSDATLILYKTILKGGTLLTYHYAIKINKLIFTLDLSTKFHIETLKSWIKNNEIHTLNIAGPRESQNKGIYKVAKEIIKVLI